MGIRERIGKALAIPAGAVTQTEQQIAVQVPSSGTSAEPLERNPADYTVPFAPGRALIPALINQPQDTGRAAPRRSEFPVAWNLQITEQRVVPYRLLRDVADGSDIVRKCIEVVKGAIAGLEWDISLSPDATERVMSDPTTLGHTAAAREARKHLLPDIIRCRDFWAMPDRINGLSFSEWVGMALEEMLVIDALSIYPNKTLDNKSLHSLEILDGATIKPLLDDRGARPVPPYPAYQQILWGFPRGEFTASADADGEFGSDDLVYAPRTRRPFTPYGYSAVEKALPVIDLYMKRQQWLRTEFTDGVTPQMFMETDATYGGNPELLKAYERVFNDDLAGKTEQRRRMRMLPEGMKPVFAPGIDSLFKPDFDEYLVKQICGHFGIMPTQIGFAPKGGLGGKGVQQGEAASSEMISLKPLILWVTDLLNQLSYRFLDMPRDLTFTFQFENTSLEESNAKRRQEQLQSGQMTINEARAELGLPLFTFPEADMPFVLSTLVPAGDVQEILEQEGVDTEGEVAIGTHSNPGDARESANNEPDVTPKLKPVSIGQSVSVNPIDIELSAFAKWTKGTRKREFVFEFIDSAKGVSLNALAKHDPAAARELVSVFKSDKPMKTENGMRFPAAAFAYVPDPSKPSTWKLRLWETPTSGPTAAQTGRAAAAFSSGGFRGNRVQIPVEDLQQVKADIRAAWHKTHDETQDELPEHLKSVDSVLKYADTFSPPAGVRSAAKRALEWIADGKAGDGFTDVGRKRASDLAAGRSVSLETVNRMRSFFARHTPDKKAEGFNSGEDGFPSPGRVAWDAWGGDAGKSWVDSLSTDKSVKASDARGREVTPGDAGGQSAGGLDPQGRDSAYGFAWVRGR